MESKKWEHSKQRNQFKLFFVYMKDESYFLRDESHGKHRGRVQFVFLFCCEIELFPIVLSDVRTIYFHTEKFLSKSNSLLCGCFGVGITCRVRKGFSLLKEGERDGVSLLFSRSDVASWFLLILSSCSSTLILGLPTSRSPNPIWSTALLGRSWMGQHWVKVFQGQVFLICLVLFHMGEVRVNVGITAKTENSITSHPFSHCTWTFCLYTGTK